MKKNILKILIFMLLCISALLTYNRITIADVGNTESYDSGSSWSSSYSGSSWSSRDRNYSGGSSGRLIESEVGRKFFYYFVLIPGCIAICVLIIIGIVKSHQLDIAEKDIKPNDPLFNKDDFLEWASKLFVKMQMAWTERDWETIRLYETPTLFEQHKTQLQEYIDKRQINVMEVIQVVNKEITNFEQVGDKDLLKVELETQMIDYIIDEDSNSVVKGSIDRVINSKYELTFIRKTGIKSKKEMLTINKTNCPNCGAEMKISAAGKCEHCGSVVTTGEFNWVLSNLERKM